MPQHQSQLKENLEAIAQFIQATEGLFTSLATIGTIGLLMFFNKVNSTNQVLIGALTGGGLLYGSGSAAMSVIRKRPGDTNIQTDQAIVQQPMNQDADAYLYHPSSNTATTSQSVVTQPSTLDTSETLGDDDKGTYYLLSEHLPQGVPNRENFDDAP